MGAQRMKTTADYDVLPELRPVHSSPRPSINPDAGSLLYGVIFMSNLNLETIEHKRGHHSRDELQTVVAHLDFIDDAERWCEENIPSGFWINERGWFSFHRSSDAYAFRDLWGDA